MILRVNKLLIILIFIYYFIYILHFFYYDDFFNKSDIINLPIEDDKPFSHFYKRIPTPSENKFYNNLFFLKSLLYITLGFIVTCFLKILQIFWLTKQLLHHMDYLLDMQVYSFNKGFIGHWFWWDIHYFNKYNVPYNINPMTVYLNNSRLVRDIYLDQQTFNKNCLKLTLFTCCIGAALKLYGCLSTAIQIAI